MVGDLKKHFDVCGLAKMVSMLYDSLSRFGASAEAMVFEK